MIHIPRALTLKYKHRVWPWDMCLREAKRDLYPVDWEQIYYGMIVVTVCLFIFGAAIGDGIGAYHKAMLTKEWACTRAEYGVIWIGDKSYPGVKCTEEINLSTEEVRKVK